MEANMGLAALHLSGAISIGNALSAFEDEIRASCPADLTSRISSHLLGQRHTAAFRTAFPQKQEFP